MERVAEALSQNFEELYEPVWTLFRIFSLTYNSAYQNIAPFYVQRLCKASLIRFL